MNMHRILYQLSLIVFVALSADAFFIFNFIFQSFILSKSMDGKKGRLKSIWSNNVDGLASSMMWLCWLWSQINAIHQEMHLTLCVCNSSRYGRSQMQFAVQYGCKHVECRVPRKQHNILPHNNITNVPIIFQRERTSDDIVFLWSDWFRHKSALRWCDMLCDAWKQVCSRNLNVNAKLILTTPAGQK